MIYNFEERLEAKKRQNAEKPSDNDNVFRLSDQFANQLKELREKGLLRPYIVGSRRPQLPQNLDLLNETGGKFARYRYYAKWFLEPYAETIMDKYGEFINLGFERTTKFKDKKDTPYRPLYPTEHVGYMSERISDLGDGCYIFDRESQHIRINVDYKHKGEIFTKAVLERYAFSPETHSTGKGNTIIKFGFAKLETNPKGQCLSSKYKALYDGIILSLSSEIIEDVTGKKPEFILNPSEECKHPIEIMTIANMVRDAVNANKTYYEPQKDILLYDLFVNRDISRTKKVIDGRCGIGLFEILNKTIETLSQMECGPEFDEQYKRIKILLLRTASQK